MGFIDALWAYMIVSAPYLLMGLLLSGLIHVFVPMEKVRKWLGGNKFSSVFRAAVIGIPLPLCSCSVIPAAVTLKKSGANNGATSAFLISTPESGVDSISLTYALIDLPMTIIRPVAAFASAFLAGILQLQFNPNGGEASEPVKSCCSKDKKKTEVAQKENKVVKAFRFGFGSLIDDLAKWLTIGILAGAMINYLVPDDFFMNFSEAQGRLLILAIGIPLYICATASTPIAASLILKGLSPGSALIFLLVGPATNISNIAVLQKYIGKKGVIINMACIGGVALAFSYIVDWLYDAYFKITISEHLHNHDHGSAAYWEIACAVILSALILKGLYKEEVLPRFKKNA